ncbi:MAG: virulence factor SrfC family protein, partial [Bacteroidota bacterium]|nr:virulence factor SrfC family protein [Bacteroidota bacterium]
MAVSNEGLLQKCTVVKQVIDDGMTWVNQNVEEDRKEVTITDLKTFRRHISRYSEAIKKRPAIAIFGQSQVGKSYLVSNLAKRPESFSLLVKVPGAGEEIDFIKNINPPGGGKEATGLVTRFTTADNFEQGWKPFELKIFSQADICCIIANGYLSDITHYVYSIDREKIQKKIAELTKFKDKSERPGFSEDDVYNVKEYLNDRFRDHFLIKDLNNINFWDDLAELIPYIDPLERWQIFEFLWGQQPFFTELFKQLSSGLNQLKFLKFVRVELDALTPQADTILDVERLRELYKLDDGVKKNSVKLYEGNTFIAELDRSIISALTAEVIMPLANETAEAEERAFLKDADVLDFPGARSRQQIPEVTFEDKDNEDKLLVFLRGKVAYLFDHYNTNFEISTLMFCMDDKQPEVTDLPKFLYDWISKVHGDSPESREQRERELELLVPQNDIDRIV